MQPNVLCKECGEPLRQQQKKFCSVRCGERARDKRRIKSLQSQTNPSSRFFIRNPHRARVCEAKGCGESRVVEIAHKVPRRGAPIRAANTQDDQVWILCPTCHRLLDRGIVSAQDLGLTT